MGRAEDFWRNGPIFRAVLKKYSALAEKSDLVLWTGDPEEVCPLRLTPTTSTTVMSVIGDVLAVLVVKLSSYSAQDYALRISKIWGLICRIAMRQAREKIFLI